MAQRLRTETKQRMSHFWKYKTNYDSLEPHFDNFKIAQVTANQRQRHISSPSAAFGWREPMHVATLHKTCLREPETNQFARCSEQGKNSISSWLLNMQESSGARAPRFFYFVQQEIYCYSMAWNFAFFFRLAIFRVRELLSSVLCELTVSSRVDAL